MKLFNSKEHWLHILIWSIFIVYETVVVGVVFGVFGNPLTYTAHYLTIIVYFYLVSLYGLPWALSNRGSKIYKLTLMLIFAITSYVLVNFIVDNLLIKVGAITHIKIVELDKAYILKEMYRCIYFSGLATAYYFLLTYLREKNKSMELERMRLKSIIAEEKMQLSLSKSQNDFLRAQINPHFLFNSLNFVYHNVDKDAELAKEGVIILSEIMRYAVETSHSEGMVSVIDEANQVNKLARLNKLRKDSSQFLEIYIDEEAEYYLIIPLVILTLTENMFKHGNLNDPVHEAMISVFTGDEKLHIHSINKIRENPAIDGANSGLANIRERLADAYGEGFTFDCKKENNIFTVRISVELQKLKKLNIQD